MKVWELESWLRKLNPDENVVIYTINTKGAFTKFNEIAGFDNFYDPELESRGVAENGNRPGISYGLVIGESLSLRETYM